MKPIPKEIAEQAWRIAALVEWTEADWKVFYESITSAFVRIAAMHAKVVLQQGAQQ